MRPTLIINLSSVLFKSYLRASRRTKVSFYSRPRVMAVINLAAFVVPFTLLQYGIPLIPEELIGFLEPLTLQVLVGMPIFLTSAIVIAGILFELGQSTSLSSSESVNWLPISHRDYVAASALSIATLYSPFLVLSVAVSLPLAIKFNVMNVWVVAMLLSVLALFLGAFIVEILRAAMNRLSSTVYRRSGRLGVISRLVLLVILFVIIQMAFNPYILFQALGIIVGGIDFVWIIPMIWPSVALLRLLNHEFLPATVFSVLSVIFVVFIFEAASYLRLKYWSPVPVSIVFNSSSVYVPQTTSLSRLGLNPLESAMASKEFRALIRRKDMARFVAIPILLVVSFVIPMSLFPEDYSRGSPGLFLAVMIPFMVPLIFSTIAVGQEGKAVINLCILPIQPKEFIKGKLAPTWVISAIATVGIIIIMEILSPMGLENMMVTLLAGILIIVVGSFIGLGVASRYPDYTVGSRSRYVTLTGFLIGFAGAGLSSLAILAPIVLRLISTGGVLNSVPIPMFDIGTTILLVVIIGSILSFLAFRYCRKGVENLLSNPTRV